jgi:murein L,D-transpeptidase YafK
MGIVHPSGSIALIRARFVRAQICRAVLASAAIAGSLALAGCYGDDGYDLPTRAMKELSPQMLAMLEQKGMPKDSPILLRIFKEESELEVWKQDTTAHYQLLKVYPICRWSGDLGPKVKEGDRQAPEGYYTITPALMNPNSNYYLAINTGFPNAFDKANDRHGAFLMIHGDCSSRGCYAMTDEQIGEIYSLAREAFLGGQQSFQIQAYPFRMTPVNLARHRNNPNLAFWKMIKEGNDHFEVTHLEPRVDVCDRHYVFDAEPPPKSNKPLAFSPTGRCPAYVVAPEIAGPALEKERSDEAQYAQLARITVPAPVTSGLDGGSNSVFLAQTGPIPPARVTPPGIAVAEVPPQPPASSHFLDGLFGSKPAAPAAPTTRVAATDSAAPEQSSGVRGFFGRLFSSDSSNAKPAGETVTGTTTAPKPASTAKPKPKTEVAKSEEHKAEPQQVNAAKPAAPPAPPQQEANAYAPAPANSANLLRGAQPVMPAGTFDSRWSGTQ